VTRSATTGLELLLLYALCAAGAALAARLLRQPIPRRLILLFALLPMLFLWPGFLRGKTPLPADHAFLTVADPEARPTTVWLDDVARQFAPWARASRRAWESGQLPHRNRWNGCGMALDGNGSSSVYFPLTLAGMLLPLPAAFTFWAAARLFLSLSGTWLWLMQLGLSRAAALFGAVAFSFSLALTAWVHFPQTSVLCLWPWVLWAIERQREPHARRRALAFLVLLFSLLPLAGHIETVASICVFTALWFAARAGVGDTTLPSGSRGRIAGAALLALGLSSFSLIPQALAILASNRLALTAQPFWGPILSALPHAPAAPSTLLLLFFPRALGDGIALPIAPGSLGSFPEMAQGYFGILGVALALLVARPGSPRAGAEKALLAPLCFGLGAAAGAWPFAEIASLVPGLNRMLPARFLVWVALTGAAIASFELDRLQKDLGHRRDAGAWLLACLGAPLALAAWSQRNFEAVRGASFGLTPENKPYLIAGATLLAALVVVASIIRKPLRFATLGMSLLTVIAGGELFRQGMRLSPFSDPDLVYRPTPLVRFLQSRPGTFRIVGQGVTLFPNVGVFSGVEDIRTHDPIERRDYTQFLDAACGYDPSAYFKQIENVNAPALDFLNVRYLVAGPARARPSEKWSLVYSGSDGTVFENASVLPRVYEPERIRPAPPGAALPFESLDWKREALVTLKGAADHGPAPDLPAPRARLSDYDETANTVSFRAQAAGPTVLVASLVQDGGWRAFAENGSSIATGRANGPFLALALPGGDHRIRLEYTTPGFRLGAAISLLSLGAAALLAAVAIGDRARQRHRWSAAPGPK
jgi:hypothetical protein